MRIEIDPKKESWKELCERPSIQRDQLEDLVGGILSDVKENGDEALIRLTAKFDGSELDSLKVSEQEISKAEAVLSEDLKEAIKLAKQNIEKFHSSQKETEERVETVPGDVCWRKNIGIEKVGLYIPGGSAPLFSTILMLGVPANLAGCKEIVLTTPPDQNGEINPASLYTASLVGVTQIFKVGGAQAIAALAFGTESIPQTYKIFGPGNQFVTKAKEMVQMNGVAIDMPAGPSEVLVIADETCDPEFVAADLLSQAEHGADSQVILLTDNETVLKNVEMALADQLEKLPRKEVAEKALEFSRLIKLKDNPLYDEKTNMMGEYWFPTPPEVFLDLRMLEGDGSHRITSRANAIAKHNGRWYLVFPTQAKKKGLLKRRLWVIPSPV